MLEETPEIERVGLRNVEGYVLSETQLLTWDKSCYLLCAFFFFALSFRGIMIILQIIRFVISFLNNDRRALKVGIMMALRWRLPPSQELGCQQFSPSPAAVPHPTKRLLLQGPPVHPLEHILEACRRAAVGQSKTLA